MQEQNITDVTFKLKELDVAGCCVGITKEVEPVYQAPTDATSYRYFHVDGYHLFISRQIKLLGPLEVTTEGLWRLKRLFLNGSSIPL